MDDLKRTQVHFEDGRRADKVVQELSNPSTGEGQVVTEFFVEPKVEKKLAKRVVETRKPVVVKREIEEVDESTGEVLSRKVESTEPEVRMELREHIQTNQAVALNAANDCDCYVTMEDMKKCFVEGFAAVARGMKDDDVAVQSHDGEKAEGVRMQSVVGERLQEKAKGFMNYVSENTVLWLVIGGLAAVLVYVAFMQ
ncbi:MAG: hypothetical protein DWQ19_12405 [Crenarchaeota archaeon]|nr:MAG: hypothetical protein DWQ19_12405 [Thermoproteota archaeon]